MKNLMYLSRQVGAGSVAKNMNIYIFKLSLTTEISCGSLKIVDFATPQLS